ncbi:MAG: protoporphyrinogen oxidase [Ilumatobacteraceae bacterium]
MRRVLVVGGGITGLSTALALAEYDAGRDVDVVVELREAAPRLGGKLHTTPFAGLPAVDEGGDAFLARVPHAAELAVAVGLGDALTSPTGATAAVWLDGLHPIPEGLLLGVPSDILRLSRSRLLSVRGKLRAALEPVLPRRDPGDSIGALVRGRFGDEVQERLVDALVGSIYAADTDRFSLAMVPQLAALAERGRSVLLSARALRAAAPPATGPLFLAPTGGMSAFADAIAATAAARGVVITTSCPVTALDADGGSWRADGDGFDAVVLATPAATTAPLLAAAAPDAARLMAMMDHAGVVLVTLAVPGWPARLAGRSGYLVPKPVQQTVTAASFGSQKWAHWRGGEGEVVRISLGRDGLRVDDLDDDTVIDRAVTEVGRHIGLDLQPGAVRISRWPSAFPQYRPHHRDWLARVRAALPLGMYVTGASYDGIGIPACIAQGQATAAAVIAGIAR